MTALLFLFLCPDMQNPQQHSGPLTDSCIDRSLNLSSVPILRSCIRAIDPIRALRAELFSSPRHSGRKHLEHGFCVFPTYASVGDGHAVLETGLALCRYFLGACTTATWLALLPRKLSLP